MRTVQVGVIGFGFRRDACFFHGAHYQRKFLDSKLAAIVGALLATRPKPPIQMREFVRSASEFAGD